jgi:hypothetical protein
MPIPTYTIRYKTYVKEALVEALREVFADHPDEILRTTNVNIDFPLTEADYPAIIIRFYERDIHNAGVGHHEFFEDESNPGRWIRYKHYLYSGDIEFAIYALSSVDRDLLSDSIVETLAMGDLSVYTNKFLTRIYAPDSTAEPASVDHAINLNTDQIQGFGETQMLAPWQPEDVMVYQTSYRIGIHGEIYSLTPETDGADYGLVERVDSFPYNPDAGEEVPDPPYAGPDGEYGTGDDVPDDGEWS